MASQRSKRSPKRSGKATKGFTDLERAAIKERAQELKAEARAGKNKADCAAAVLAAIVKMPQPDRSIGARLHAIVTANAPALTPRLWYGMPAYANQAGKVVVFFQAATKFKTRYSSFGFMDAANLDDGAMWPTGFALKDLTGLEEAKIGALVKKAVS
jgi:uncharacterized protein YdhG (YjbR/CyaY superfamily)